MCSVLPTVSLPGSYTGGVLCHSETLHITLQPDHHGYGLSVVSPDPSLPALIISSIDPGGPADRYDKETLYWLVCSNKFTLSVELSWSKVNVNGVTLSSLENRWIKIQQFCTISLYFLSTTVVSED